MPFGVVQYCPQLKCYFESTLVCSKRAHVPLIPGGIFGRNTQNTIFSETPDRSSSFQIIQRLTSTLLFNMSVDLCKVPAGTPPTGTTSNLVNPTSLGGVTMGTEGLLIAIGVIFTVARFYVNFRRLAAADCQCKALRPPSLMLWSLSCTNTTNIYTSD